MMDPQFTSGDLEELFTLSFPRQGFDPRGIFISSTMETLNVRLIEVHSKNLLASSVSSPGVFP